MNSSTELVARLWRLCAVLRKDGITYPQYVSELTYLLFLKMMHETGAEVEEVPENFRWQALLNAPSGQKLTFYQSMLSGLGADKNVALAIRRIFQGANSVLRDSKNLEMLIEAIGKIDWFIKNRDSFGDLYEGLLQKNAEETKRGAGQYFTPRPIVDVIIRLMKPHETDVIQDPAAGTGGFLVLAHEKSVVSKAKKNKFGPIISGMENVKDTYRLLLMNLYLHGIDASNVYLGDALSQDYKKLHAPSLILTNPPFGPAGGRPTRSDLIVTSTVSSYQLPFVEHCIRSLAERGRAAIIIPDNVLFDDGRGRALREYMLQTCNLHTILRLPTGIFYAPGVKTNVIFFNKTDEGTKSTWIYDLRTGAPTFGRSKQLDISYFNDFMRAYGARPDGSSPRQDGGFNNRFRCFKREEITSRNENLDITWLRDNDDDPDADLSEPEELTGAIAAHLKSALTELESIAEEVENDLLSSIIRDDAEQ